MSHNRRKWKPDQVRRLESVRTYLADRCGNLYGLKLGQFFSFNGEEAFATLPRLEHFKTRLTRLRNSRGSQAMHRARREAAKAAA